jgi:RNA polymerase sigma factor (sigma-70 family)
LNVLTVPTASRELSDDALMSGVAARDSAAFRVLVDRHSARPYRVAWRMLNDRVEAEDVAQEALLRLWDKAENWRAGEAGVSAWLTRVATNLCLDRLRRMKFSSDEEVPERTDETPLADQLIEEDQIRALAIAAVQALPQRQRAAIILTYYEDVSNQVAAQMLDMNIKAFESLLLRARLSLRGALADLKGEVS